MFLRECELWIRRYGRWGRFLRAGAVTYPPKKVGNKIKYAPYNL